MSDIVKVPYTELLQRAQRIRQQADIVRQEIQSLNETVESIQWIGRRADRFFSMWETAKPEMESWATVLENFANDLELQAQRMQAADESF